MANEDQIISDFLEWLYSGGVDEVASDLRIGRVYLAHHPYITEHPIVRGGRVMGHTEVSEEDQKRNSSLQPLDLPPQQLLALYKQRQLATADTT